MGAGNPIPRATVDLSNLHHTDGNAEGYSDSRARPVEVMGALLFPAYRCLQGVVTVDSDAHFVQLDLVTRSMLGNDLGVFVRLTPEGARHIAGQLIADAQEVENMIAAQADAAIEKARGAGGAQ